MEEARRETARLYVTWAAAIEPEVNADTARHGRWEKGSHFWLRDFECWMTYLVTGIQEREQPEPPYSDIRYYIQGYYEVER